MSATQTVYGRIATLAYAGSEMVEVGAVTAVHYLLHGTTLFCSHKFQSLHLGRHLNDLDKIEADVNILPLGNSYIHLMLLQTINFDLWNWKKNASTIILRNSFCRRKFQRTLTVMLTACAVLLNIHFLQTKIVRRRKVKVIADIIGPRILDFYEITEDDLEKYSKIALLLFKPHRSRKKYSTDFHKVYGGIQCISKKRRLH